MRIAMIGHKRYGSREGGVEVVVTELARRMAAMGHEVTCYDRSGSDVATVMAAETGARRADGVRVVPVRTVNGRGLAALSSSFFATRQAVKDAPDVIHYHAEGPCVPLGLASRRGIRTVATIHGLDWQRAKWGRLASSYIKLGERVAAEKADAVIVLGRSAGEYFEREYGRSTVTVPNGVEPKRGLPAAAIREKWGLEPGSYALFLGRIVPEKGLRYLIEAYGRLATDKRLVIAGGGSDTSAYVEEVRGLAARDARITFTGFVEGGLLDELYSNAYCFVLPSDVEGMPMSLLEAMSFGCCCVTSDIPECADVVDGCGVVFPKGDAAALGDALAALFADATLAASLGEAARRRALETYDWGSVVERTLEVYQGALE